METSLAALHSQSPEIIADNCKISSLTIQISVARENVQIPHILHYSPFSRAGREVEKLSGGHYQCVGVYEELVADSIRGLMLVVMISVSGHCINHSY